MDSSLNDRLAWIQQSLDLERRAEEYRARARAAERLGKPDCAKYADRAADDYILAAKRALRCAAAVDVA